MGAKRNFNQAMQEVFKLNRAQGTSRDSNLAKSWTTKSLNQIID